MIDRTSRRRAGCILACLLAVACAPAPPKPVVVEPGIEVVGIVIRNALAYSVHDVMVQVPATGRFAGCGNIVQNTECRTSFPAIEYGKNTLLVTWTEHGEPQATEEFVVEPPAGTHPGDSLWLEVVIYNKGLAGARLVQP